VLLMGLLAPLAPRLAVRFGLERTISLCLGLIGLALMLRLLGDDPVILIGTAAMVGAGIAVAGPLWLVLKTLVVMALLLWLGRSLARLSPERFVTLAWLLFLPLSFADLVWAGVEAMR